MNALTYGSVCSGIEAASVAWAPLGWEAAFVSEIEAAPRAVLQHRFPGVPLHGDFTTIQDGDYRPIQLLVGGTPCQSFSVAGLRGGLADDRGNLALQFLRLADRLRPRWLVWENVPGVLSSNGGRDFGAILGGMVELGYGFAYRVLDAQYIRVDGYGRAVPQRRRRVFVVGYLGDWRRPAAVLLERASLRGDPAPCRGAREGFAASASDGPGGGCRGPGRAEAGRPAAQAFGGGQNCNPTDVSTALTGHPDGRYDLQNETFVAEPVCSTLGGTSPGGGWRLGADEASGGQLVAALTAGDRGISVDQAAANMILPVAQTLRARDSANGVDSDCTDTLLPVARPLRGQAQASHRPDSDTYVAVARTLVSGGHSNNPLDENLLAFDTTQITSGQNRANPQPGDPCHPLSAGAHPPAIAFNSRQDPDVTWDQSGSLSSSSPQAEAIAFIGHNGGPSWAVRRLTPTECERLQGFPDGWTAVPWRGGIMPDGPRYKMLGNSMAVNCMRWIGRRIEAVEAEVAA